MLPAKKLNVGLYLYVFLETGVEISASLASVKWAATACNLVNSNWFMCTVFYYLEL